MKIEIPREFPLYAFVPEWLVYTYWVTAFVLYLLLKHRWNQWLTLSYSS